MKNKLILLTVVLATILISCQNNNEFDTQEVTTQNEVEISFDLDIEELKTETRASKVTNKVYLLVFDEVGLWKSSKLLELKGKKAQCSLPAYNDGLNFHFIWAETDALMEVVEAIEQNLFEGVNEGELINQISSEHELYWATKQISSLTNNMDLKTISLLRNKARISVVNKTSENDRFEILGYAIHNAPTRGTIAPFDGLKQSFRFGVITEAYPLAYQTIAPMDAQGNLLVAEENVQFTDDREYVEVFERSKSTATSPFYLIMKASYRGRIGYYKLGFYDSKSLQRMDIKRNTHYIVNIISVAQAGYNSLQDAINNAPVENASLSVLLEEYTKIANNNASLEIGGTAFALHAGNEPFSVSYEYNSVDGSARPDIELIQTPGQEVFIPSSFDYTYQSENRGKIQRGVIQGVTNPDKNNNQRYSAQIRVRFGDLVRIINVELGPKRNLDARITSYGDDVDDLVIISFNLSKSDLSNSSMLPIDFFIDTHYLYPSTNRGYNSNLSVITDADNGHYHYQYTATNFGQQVIYFQRSLSNKNEIVSLKSDHFKTSQLSLSTSDKLVDPTIIQGKIYYLLNGEKVALPKNTRVLVNPSDMPRSFWLPEQGQYEFQFDKKHLDRNEEFTITVDPIDGVNYKYSSTFESLLSSSEIILQSKEVLTAAVYAYSEGTSTKMDMRDKTIYAANHPEISIERHPDYLWDTHYLQIKFPSSLRDSETITIYAVDNKGRRTAYYARTTVERLKENSGLDFYRYE